MILFTIFLLLTITITGIIFLRFLIEEDKSYILIPAGTITGITVFIFLLNLSSKFFPGSNGIIISCISFTLLAALTYYLTKPHKIKLPNLSNILVLVILTLIVIYLARLKMTSVFPVADSDMQWAYASSFARGNFPIKASWQADLNPNYHLGTYFFEGALLYLTSLPLITIHSILNTYFLIVGCLFILFIFWNEKIIFNNIWVILAMLITYISFGIIIFTIPNINLFSNSFISETIKNYILLPETILAKGTAGAALVDLNSLSYLPARSLSINMAFLILYLTFSKFRNNNLKITSLILVFSVIALVEESMFLPLFLTLCSLAFVSLFSKIFLLNQVAKNRKIILTILIGTLVTIFIQGGFIEDLLHQKGSSYNILLPFSKEFLEKARSVQMPIIPSISESYYLLILNPVFISLITLIYSIINKKRKLLLISIYSIVAFICFLSIDYKYCLSCNLRLQSFSYIAGGLGLSTLMLYLFQNKSNTQNLIFSIIFFILIGPSLLPEIINQYNQIKIARINNHRSQILTQNHPNTRFESISNFAKNMLPVNSRLLSIDTDLPSPKRAIQFQYKGIYTTLSPINIHTTRPEPGPEYFDLILTLNPSLIKQTKTDYIYIESDSDMYKQLPQYRKKDLENNQFFENIQTSTEDNKFYILYKVLPRYLDPTANIKNIEHNNLEALKTIIPDIGTVFIENYGTSDKLLSFWYRMAIILSLKDKDIYRNLSQTDYQVIETDIPYKNGNINKSDYKFYILGPNGKPPIPSELIWSNIYASAWKAE